ncbi:cell division protein DivIVA [Methylobacterium sp. J-072]|uniref:cell division protein DivIVA n=1 Tax=Methylobacterium sp. J-072 TaxID=2836651 RepID=UPI001FBB385D|nr:cell division protein DivIVA [Methylobacterium sp. J-072]MCJ2095255.1 cell division protein DivIVA [Methylobacterium sp. J-072]
MATAAQFPWPTVLTQLAAGLDEIAAKPAAEILRLRSSLGVVESPPTLLIGAAAGSEPPTVPTAVELGSPVAAARSEGVDDWMGTLDIINGMAGLADEQERRWREQGMSHQAALTALRQELQQAEEKRRAAEMRTREVQAQSDIRLQRAQADANAQVQDIRAEAEARVRMIRTEAEALVRQAEERARVADLRASTAEQWLQRIDTAAKKLLSGGQASPDRAPA